MWFKNLQIYRFTSPFNLSNKQLEDQLGRYPFRSCTGYELQTQGWASPRENGSLLHAAHGQMLIMLGTEKKLLPASVIRETVKLRAADLERTQGFKPGRKQLRELKEQISDELLPRAFNVRRDIRIWIDPAHGWLVVDSSSAANADAVVSLLNKSLDSLALERLNVTLSPTVAMTAWLAADDIPHGFSVDQDTELQSPVEEKATVRFVRHALDPVEIKRHIKAGKQCTRLALTWAHRVSFVLTESLVIKRVTPLNVTKEGIDAVAEDEEERFDADFALMSGELHGMITALVEALGGVAKS
jgi:recombination associated protein RdgC